MPGNSPHKISVFDGFEFDLLGSCLRRDGKDIPLSYKAFDVLKQLVEKAGMTVSVQELFAAVWPEAKVQTEDEKAEYVRQKISEIRHAHERLSEIIVTRIKHGYLLDSTVTEEIPLRFSSEANVDVPPNLHTKVPTMADDLPDAPPPDPETNKESTISEDLNGETQTGARDVSDPSAPVEESDKESTPARPTAQNIVQVTDGDHELATTPPANEDLNDGMNTFKEWLFGSGKIIAGILFICVLLVLALSVKGTTNNWEWINSYVSIAQLVVLLFALIYPLGGPKGFKQTGDTVTENIKSSTGYDDPKEWREASGIAEKVFERYNLYWRGILVTWFLLYGCLTLTGLPDLDLNCQVDASQFCVGGLSDPAALVAKLQNDHPVSKYLLEKFPSQTQQALKAYRRSSPLSKDLQRLLVDGLNRIQKDNNLYNPDSFKGVELSPETKDLIGREKQLSDEALVSFNHLLLQDYLQSQPDITMQRLGIFLRIFTTAFNNGSSLMIFLCFNILNKPTKIKRTGNIKDNALSIGAALVGIATLIEILLVVGSSSIEKKYFILQLWSWGSGIFGGVAMALYIGRLQSKFLGPPDWLIVLLYSYTVIQSLFVFLEERQEAAVVLMDFALMMKCLLFLYMAWLFKSGRLLFYLVRVRRTYQGVKKEFGIFRKTLDEET
ncbi:MAG: hypothetical protein QOH96_1400 [Blastocatellia bacterium]|jgi:DNA-binding winged helix-turn-helix (wHTH) protein|nr:hypothetical protein [Blastocatellia bacterium]